MNPALIINQDELKKTLKEIFEEIAPSVVGQIKTRTPPTVRELMTLAQAAEYLQCSTQSIVNWSKRPRDRNPLAVCYAGADPRFYKSEIDDWLRREAQIRRGGKKLPLFK